MSKFLDLCEEFDPANNEDPKWRLIDFLKSKGVHVSLVRDTDMLYIDTGEGDTAVAIQVMNAEEDAEYGVDTEVEKLANQANSGLTGLAAKVIGTSAQKAKTSVKKRQNLAKQAVDVYDQGTKKLEQGIKNAKMQNTGASKITY